MPIGSRIKTLATRDGWKCHYCERDLSLDALRAAGLYSDTRKMAGFITVDHVIPRALAGPDTLWNMVLACAPCNNAKSDIPYERFTGRTMLPPQCWDHAETTERWCAMKLAQMHGGDGTKRTKYKRKHVEPNSSIAHVRNHTRIMSAEEVLGAWADWDGARGRNPNRSAGRYYRP
jgi:CRISPR/Cas system Type II protein with McrA/HNH and RuvC-like nuclease domain